MKYYIQHADLNIHSVDKTKGVVFYLVHDCIQTFPCNCIVMKNADTQELLVKVII